jgi:cystathionine gamma-synthase
MTDAYEFDATAALHADRSLRETPDIAPPLRSSTTFTRTEGGPSYRRDWDPTTRRVEAVIGALEGGHAVCFPSGMAAVGALLRHLRPARVSLPHECYHGVRELAMAAEEEGAWDLVAPDRLEPGDVEWLETPSNPTCRITDIAAVSDANQTRGVTTVVDATFATPVLQRTLQLGADYVMHSTTKFIAGHSDAMGGVIVTGDAAEAALLIDERAREGYVPGALETWLTLRGLRTLPLRVERQSTTALEVATHLTRKAPIVHYPGLESHPGHAVAARQMTGFGGIVSFEMSDRDTAAAVVSRLRLFWVATSLGGVESLAEHRIVSDPSAPPGLIRLSIGLEAAADLVGDLDQAITGSSD